MLKSFFRHESSTGIVSMLMTLLMIVANSAIKSYYDAFLDLPVLVSIGSLTIAKPLLLWVNDALMAIFFFMVGLEISRGVRKVDISIFALVDDKGPFR
jgi:NhaA family Na+:H+ antiporter